MAVRQRPSLHDRRRVAVLLSLGAIVGGGLLLRPGLQGAAPSVPVDARAPTPPRAHSAEVQRRFDEAVVMLHARRFDDAATALHRVLALAPTLPDAHVNMGYALLGLRRVSAARGFFESALALEPGQANAYYGLALTWEADGDLAMATGAMRTYLHLARTERPEHLRRARAALWEWEQAASAPAGRRAASAPAAR